jgi:hypothetical protein
MVDHLAVPSALYNFLPDALKDRKKGLDDRVFQDYAALLLPRAVGYSAALLDYFFRGSLTVWRAYWDDSKVIIDLANDTDEVMEGVFEVYAISDKGSAEERRWKFASLEGGASITLPAYSSHTFRIDIPAGQRLTRHHILVFRGKLGVEPDAVVGRVFLVQPLVLFVQRDYQADIVIHSCDRYTWPDPGNASPNGSLAEDSLSCLWTSANRQISGSVVKNIADPLIERIVARTESGAGTKVTTIWQRQGTEADPTPVTVNVSDPAGIGERIFLDVYLTDSGVISTTLATLGLGLSRHAKVIPFEDVGPNKTYAVVSAKYAYLSLVLDRDRDETISISGYPNPTDTLAVTRSYGSITASEGVVVNSDVYQESVIETFEIYPGGWIEPPQFDPAYAAPQSFFDTITLEEPQFGGLRITWEAIVERVYRPDEIEFLRAFMPDAPVHFTIPLHGTTR